VRLARWYRPLSPTNALQRITHVFGGQCRQLDFRDGKVVLTACPIYGGCSLGARLHAAVIV
jgi:hypothetical protein